MKTVKILLVAAVVAAVLIGVAVAQQGGGGGGPGGGPGGGTGRGTGMGRMGMGMSPVRMVIMMAERLELSDDEVSKLEALKPEDPNAIQKAQQEMADVQSALQAAVMAGDDAKIKETCKKIGPAQEKVSLLQAKEYKQIKGILTPEHYKALQDMMTRPMGGRTGAGAPGRTGGGPGGPGGAGPGGNRPGGGTQ